MTSVITATDMAHRTDHPTRRCIATGYVGERSQLVRFVVSPEGAVVPDINERLPGRGIWVTANRCSLETARGRKLFAKAARASVRVQDNLAEQVEVLLLRRCQDLLGLAWRAGQATFGYQRVREWLVAAKGGLLIEASDGALGDWAKLRALAGRLPIIDVLSAEEIGTAVGRERFVHGVLVSGRLAEHFAREASRLAGLRCEAGSPKMDSFTREVK